MPQVLSDKNVVMDQSCHKNKESHVTGAMGRVDVCEAYVLVRGR